MDQRFSCWHACDRNRLQSQRRFHSSIVALACFAGLLLVTTDGARGQGPIVHDRHFGNMPPGAVGQDQLNYGGPRRGYFQPVEVVAPQGAEVSLMVDGQYQRSGKHRVKAGMLIGQVYAVKVTRIPDHPGFEVYPTIEVIDRLYPPEGQATRFPIPIHVTQEELEMALNGQFVTRVIYLEDPTRALPVHHGKDVQEHFEVGLREDPLRVADQLGRPMAILRMGSRIPDAALRPDVKVNSPPLHLYQQSLPKQKPAEQPANYQQPATTGSTSTTSQNASRIPTHHR